MTSASASRRPWCVKSRDWRVVCASLLRRWASLCNSLAREVSRIKQAIGMIDAQARDLALRKQSQRQCVRLFEYILPLHRQCGQLIHIKEPAVVNFVRRNLPVREPIALAAQQIIQGVEAV